MAYKGITDKGAESRRASFRASLVMVGSLGLLIQGADIFMVPGYFNFEFVMSVLVIFGIGLVIAACAGSFYVRYDAPNRLGFKAVVLSLPVVVFCVGTVALFVIGYLNYNPPPKG